jgi:hypothetical protein
VVAPNRRVRVADHAFGRVDLELQPLGGAGGARRVGDQVARVDGRHRQAQDTVLDPRDGEQVLDEPGETFGLRLRRVDQLDADAVVEHRTVLLEGAQHTEDRRERGPELVSGDADELGPREIHLAQALNLGALPTELTSRGFRDRLHLGTLLALVRALEREHADREARDQQKRRPIEPRRPQDVAPNEHRRLQDPESDGHAHRLDDPET